MLITCGLIFHAVDPSHIQHRKEEEWKRNKEKKQTKKINCTGGCTLHLKDTTTHAIPRAFHHNCRMCNFPHKQYRPHPMSMRPRAVWTWPQRSTTLLLTELSHLWMWATLDVQQPTSQSLCQAVSVLLSLQASTHHPVRPLLAGST